jgi:hypothetical protein
VEKLVSLACLLVDAGKQPRRRTAEDGGESGETLASVALARAIRHDGEVRRPVAGTEGPAEEARGTRIRVKVAGGKRGGSKRRGRDDELLLGLV